MIEAMHSLSNYSIRFFLEDLSAMHKTRHTCRRETDCWRHKKDKRIQLTRHQTKTKRSAPQRVVKNRDKSCQVHNTQLNSQFMNIHNCCWCIEIRSLYRAATSKLHLVPGSRAVCTYNRRRSGDESYQVTFNRDR
jgi:hypothetical protein